MYERTQAQINLNALEANIAAIRQKIGPDTKLLGVIKADAYGHGAVHVARTLQELGACLLYTSPSPRD